MKMDTNNGVSFHGELAIVRAELLGITELPDDAKRQTAVDGKHVLAHSESGHHHFINAVEAEFYESSDPLVCYLRVAGEVTLQHGKPMTAPDRHGNQLLPAGLYRVTRQREWAPDGWGMVHD